MGAGKGNSLAVLWLEPKSKSACLGFYFSNTSKVFFSLILFDYWNLTSPSGDGQGKYDSIPIAWFVKLSLT